MSYYSLSMFAYVSAVHECTLYVVGPFYYPLGVAAGIDFLLDVGVPHSHGYCYDYIGCSQPGKVGVQVNIFVIRVFVGM